MVDGSPVRDAEGIIADGSIRSGKTVSLSLGFCLWSMSRFSGQNFALCGKTISPPAAQCTGQKAVVLAR